MPRVLLDHNPNAGVVEIEEAEILDMERLGFSVTRVDQSKKAESDAPASAQGKGK
jgi:hypothetical protein